MLIMYSGLIVEYFIYIQIIVYKNYIKGASYIIRVQIQMFILQKKKYSIVKSLYYSINLNLKCN